MVAIVENTPHPKESLNNKLDFLGQVVHMHLKTNGEPNHFELTTNFFDNPPYIASCQAERKFLQMKYAYPANDKLQAVLAGEINHVEVDHRQPNAWTMFNTPDGRIACVIKTDNSGQRCKIDALGAGGPKSKTDIKVSRVAVDEGPGEEGITVWNGYILAARGDAEETISAIEENVSDYVGLGGEIPRSHKEALDKILSGHAQEAVKIIDYGFHPILQKLIDQALPSIDITTKDASGNTVELLSNVKAVFHPEGIDIVRGFPLPDGAILFDSENFHNPDKGRRENLNRDIALLTLEQIAEIGNVDADHPIRSIHNVPVFHNGELYEEKTITLPPASLLSGFSKRIKLFL